MENNCVAYQVTDLDDPSGAGDNDGLDMEYKNCDTQFESCPCFLDKVRQIRRTD